MVKSNGFKYDSDIAESFIDYENYLDELYNPDPSESLEDDEFDIDFDRENQTLPLKYALIAICIEKLLGCDFL